MAPALQVSAPGPKNIPIDAIISLVDQGRNNVQIAKELGCNDSNISHRLSTYGYSKDRPAQIEKTKKTVFNLLQAKVINSIRSEEIEKAPFQTKIWTIGVLEDKIQALDKKAQAQAPDDTGLDDLSNQLSRIAARSPIVINNILNIVGNLPADVRDRLNNLMPSSLLSKDNSGIIEGHCQVVDNNG